MIIKIARVYNTTGKKQRKDNRQYNRLVKRRDQGGLPRKFIVEHEQILSSRNK